MQKKIKEQSRINGALLGQFSGSSSRNMHSTLKLCRTKAHIQVTDGNFRLRVSFLQYHPVTSSPINQKKKIYPKCAYEKPQNHQGIQDTEHKSPVLLGWLCNKPFSALEDLNRHFSKGDIVVFVCVQFFNDPMDYIAHQVPPSMDFTGKNTGVGCHSLPQEQINC